MFYEKQDDVTFHHCNYRLLINSLIFALISFIYINQSVSHQIKSDEKFQCHVIKLIYFTF